MKNTHSITEEENRHVLKHIGELVHTLRHERGITQAEFAKRLDTTQSAVARIEKGEQNPSAVMLSRINKALNANVINLTKGSLNIKIRGGRTLSGSITTHSSKNGAVGLLCASLVNKGKTTLRNVPRIEEVFRIIETMESIGVTVSWSGNDLIITPPERFSMKDIDRVSAGKTRSVIMFISGLAHRMESFRIPKAGGCRLGSRSIKPHTYALRSLGIRMKNVDDEYEISSKNMKANTVILYESGDTVTENTLIAAAGIPGKTVIKYASANYQVQDLCFYLQELGVTIEGIGTTTLTVHGVEDIEKDVIYTVSEDPIESMFFIATAIVTNSSFTIKRCPIDFLELELLKLEKMGFKYKRSKEYKGHNDRVRLVDITPLPSKLTALPEKIDSRPYPGLNIDNLPFFAVIATQAKGRTFIHDWVYEDRAIYYKELDKIGAQVLVADPHRVYITGKSELKANEVVCPPALRPAAIILIGMLGADGVSILRNIYSINRGYEDIISRLNGLGAKISIVSDL